MTSVWGPTPGAIAYDVLQPFVSLVHSYQNYQNYLKLLGLAVWGLCLCFLIVIQSRYDTAGLSSGYLSCPFSSDMFLLVLSSCLSFVSRIFLDGCFL